MLIAVALVLAALSPHEASAAWGRGRDTRPNITTANYRPMLARPDTILPRLKDVRTVPNPGGGRLVGYTLNFHPAGRAARMLLIRR